MKSRSLLFLCLLFVPAESVAQSGIASSRFEDVLTVLSQCRDAYYRLEDYRGTVLQTTRSEDGGEREERIDIAFRKSGFLSLRWVAGLYKGTTLLARPGWNQGNVLLRLGEWFDFLTISVPLTEMGEPFQPALKDMSDWLTALAALAQRPVTDRSLRTVEVQTLPPQLPVLDGKILLSVPAFLIPFRDNTVATYEFVVERGTGIPTELLLRGAGGEVRQHVIYTDLQVNVGLPTQLFTWEQDGQEPPAGISGTTLDLRGFAQHWQRRSGEITDYKGMWITEVRVGSTVQREQGAFKFRKPLDLYLHWEPGMGKFQEALFRQGWNNDRVRVRRTVWGLSLIGDLASDHPSPSMGGPSFVMTFGILPLVDRAQEQLLHGWLRGELRTQFLGVQTYDSRLCYVLAFEFTPGPEREGAISRIVMTWDIAERLLVHYESFGITGRGEAISERHEFRGVQVNTGLGDLDFDTANPDYGFLLLRSMPWLDRFLTGRD